MLYRWDSKHAALALASLPHELWRAENEAHGPLGFECCEVFLLRPRCLFRLAPGFGNSTGYANAVALLER